MKRSLTIGLFILALVVGLSARAQTDAEVDARKAARDLAGAFTNDGFKIRDGHWCGTVKPNEHSLVAVNLYAGNQYWFTAAASESVKKIAVSVYDETGKQVTTENFDSGEKASAGYSPTGSGQYFVAVDLVDGKEGTFCLVYSYK